MRGYRRALLSSGRVLASQGRVGLAVELQTQLSFRQWTWLGFLAKTVGSHFPEIYSISVYDYIFACSFIFSFGFRKYIEFNQMYTIGMITDFFTFYLLSIDMTIFFTFTLFYINVFYCSRCNLERNQLSVQGIIFNTWQDLFCDRI